MTACFENFKGFFYTLRILRELVPAFLVTFSFYSIFAALMAGILQSAYSIAYITPYKSHGLDLNIAAIDFRFGADHTCCTDNITARIDIFTNDWVPKADQDWRNTESNDWWCLAFISQSVYAVPVNGNFTIDMCAMAIWNSTNNIGPLLGGFPDADPGWRCRSAHSVALPTTAPEGRSDLPYSACIDVYGDVMHAVPLFPYDMYFLFFSPVFAHCTFLLVWIHQKEMLGGYWGTAHPALKVKYLFIGIGFWALCYFTATLPPAGEWIPGGINIALPGFSFIYGMSILCLAVEDLCKPLHYFARPLVLFAMCLGEVKDRDPASFGCKWPLDSDTALCFFLEQGYKTKANKFVKVILYVCVFGFIGVFLLLPTELGVRSVFTAVLTTFLLLLIKVYGGLRALKMNVDYRVIYNDSMIKMPKPEHATLLAVASDIVELTCTTFVSLHGGESNAGQAPTPARVVARRQSSKIFYLGNSVASVTSLSSSNVTSLVGDDRLPVSIDPNQRAWVDLNRPDYRQDAI